MVVTSKIVGNGWKNLENFLNYLLGTIITDKSIKYYLLGIITI